MDLKVHIYSIYWFITNKQLSYKWYCTYSWLQKQTHCAVQTNSNVIERKMYIKCKCMHFITWDTYPWHCKVTLFSSEGICAFMDQCCRQYWKSCRQEAAVIYSKRVPYVFFFFFEKLQLVGFYWHCTYVRTYIAKQIFFNAYKCTYLLIIFFLLFDE